MCRALDPTQANPGASIWRVRVWTPSSENPVLAALEPAALELSLSATQRLEQERAELDRLWRQRRERAAYEVERAGRQYQAVEPEHRLVARTLERAWARETNREASA